MPLTQARPLMHAADALHAPPPATSATQVIVVASQLAHDTQAAVGPQLPPTGLRRTQVMVASAQKSVSSAQYPLGQGCPLPGRPGAHIETPVPGSIRQ